MSMFNSGNESPKGVTSLRISSPPETQRKAYHEQTLIPVTIHSILHADGSPTGNGPITLNDGTHRDLHQVKIVGAIRSVEEESTSTTYMIEDGTGLIQVKHWSDSNENSSTTQNPAHDESAKPSENDYVRVIGQIKNYQDQKQLVAYSLRKLSSGNELTHHMLEVVFSGQRAKQQQSGISADRVSSIYDVNTPKKNLNEQFAQGAESNELNDVILHFIQREIADKGNDQEYKGVTMDKIVANLQPKFTSSDIQNAMTLLADEGLLYSTVDENTFSTS